MARLAVQYQNNIFFRKTFTKFPIGPAYTGCPHNIISRQTAEAAILTPLSCRPRLHFNEVTSN
jgi:hypothetical protein